jgi:hypothetical protein
MQGRTKQRQEDWFRATCEREGFIPDETLRFFDRGRSRFHAEHLGPKGELTRFLNLMRNGVIPRGSVLCIEMMDRLSRQEVDDAYDTFREILKAGIWIALADPPRIYKEKPASIFELMEPLFLMAASHEPSKRLSLRISDRRENERKASQQGVKHNGKLPAWVKWVDGEYETIPERAAALKEAIRLVTQEGLGMNAAADILNARSDEFPPSGNTSLYDQPREAKWRGGTLLKLLCKRSLFGEYQPFKGRRKDRKPAGPPIQDYFPPLCTKEEFDSLQAAIRGRANKSGKGGYGRRGEIEKNLFTSLVWSARSMSPMSLFTNARKGKTTRYHLAPTDTTFRGKAGQQVPYQQFQNGILRCLQSLVLADVLPPDDARRKVEQDIKKMAERLVAIQASVSAIENEISKPENLAAVPSLASSVTMLKAEEKLLVHRLEIANLRTRSSRGAQLGEIQSIISLLDHLNGTPQEGETIRRLKASLKSLVEEIWVFPELIGRRNRQPLYAVHVQIHLRGDIRIPLVILPDGLATLPVLRSLDDADFRGGDVSDCKTSRRSAR